MLKGPKPAVAVLLVVGVLGLAGCGSSGHRAGGTATVPGGGSTTTVAGGAGLGTMTLPAGITIAYVQQVINKLDVIYGDAFRALVADRAVTPRVQALLGEAFVGQALTSKMQFFNTQAKTGFSLLAASPGNPSTDVLALVSTSPCPVVKTRRSFATVYRAGFETGFPFVFIALKHEAPDPGNSTGWHVELDGANSQDGVPSDPCGST